MVLRGDELSHDARQELKLISLEERKTTFKETTFTMEKERVMQEGKRCIECSCTDKSSCKLRQYADEYGCDVNAFSGEKQLPSYDVRHPLIIQDRGKCIKCGVCVKICKEVVNKGLLSQKKRGFYTVIGTAFESGFPASCADCGECVNACPTGALGWRKKK